MKLPIRFAHQIVGAFIVFALGLLVFVIFMLGSNQRWFSRDYSFISYFGSAAGLSQNMPVQYRGFTIGRVKSIKLAENDQVEVRFIIFDTYIDRVRYGSMVEMVTSPIGALGGSQFLFHPGLGEELLNEGDVIHEVSSPEGEKLMRARLTVRTESDDSINRIILRVGELLVTLDEALKGNGETSLGQIVGNITKITGDLQPIPREIEDTIDRLMTRLDPILLSLESLAGDLSNPDGSLAAILDSEGDVYPDLVKSLNSLSGILRNLEKTTDFIPPQLPQVALMLTELTSALATAEDVLVALTNNPLLKQGIPERKETNAGGVLSRDIEF